MAVNGAKHVLYVTNNSETIYAIDTITGPILEEIKPGGGFRGVAVDESDDTLFAFAYETQRVREIPLALVPKAVTGEPIGNRKVSGTVAPDGAGNITECKFEWGEGVGNYNKPAVPCDQATPITSETAVTATLPTGEALSETEYHYRLRAGTATPGGVNFGSDEVITPHNVLGLLTKPATAITRTTATLNGQFEGNGEADRIQIRMGRRQNRRRKPELEQRLHLRWKPGDRYDHTPELPCDRSDRRKDVPFPRRREERRRDEQRLRKRIHDASRGLEHHHRRRHGSHRHRGDTARVFDIDAEGGDSHYYFQYGAGTNLRVGRSRRRAPGCGRGQRPGHPVRQQTIEVTAGETVHFRIVAINSFGTTSGQDKSFKTPNKPPIVALLLGECDGVDRGPDRQDQPQRRRHDVSLRIRDVPRVRPHRSDPGRIDRQRGSPVEVSQHIANLEIGATHHFRVVAENQWGEVTKPDQTFAFFTANCPNAHVRQESGAAYLPDCRAYELASPEVAGAVQLFPGQGLARSSTNSSPIRYRRTRARDLALALRLLGRDRPDQWDQPAQHHSGPLRRDPHLERLEDPLPRPIRQHVVRFWWYSLQRDPGAV